MATVPASSEIELVPAGVKLVEKTALALTGHSATAVESLLMALSGRVADRKSRQLSGGKADTTPLKLYVRY